MAFVGGDPRWTVKGKGRGEGHVINHSVVIWSPLCSLLRCMRSVCVTVSILRGCKQVK